MSPEQLRSKDLDARSDLFSLGLVLYEAATGRPAFTGETSAVISGAILHQEPQAPRQVRSELPARLEDILFRTLEKDREDRYQTAADLRAELRRLNRGIESRPPLGATAPITAPLSADAASRASTPLSPSSISPTGTTSNPSSDAQMVAAMVKRHRGGVAVAAALVVLALVGSIYALQRRAAQVSLQDLQVVQLTTSGTAERPAIAPNGKYVAYIEHEGNAYSLWIRQIATTSHVPIVPSEPGTMMVGATVTPDEGFVDFVRVRPGDPNRELWRVPFLGGTPKKLIDNIDSPPGWSPNGQHMAFVRRLAGSSRALIVADGDGSHERVVKVRRVPAYFYSLGNAGNSSIRPAWSPDGRVVALLGFDQPGGVLTYQFVTVDVTTGSERVLSLPFALNAGLGLAWLDSGSLVLSRATDAGEPTQLWRLTYPGGQLSRLTNDLSNYAGVSLTADHGGLVTARSDMSVAVWVGDGSGIHGAEVVSPAVFRGSPDFARVAWAADHLLHATTANGQASIAAVVPGRGEAADIVATGLYPAATSDGQTIVYAVRDAGDRLGLWRIDADGRHPVHLVIGQALWPVVTADDRYIIFISTLSGVQAPWRVSIDGGPPTQLENVFVARSDVSRDGKWVFGSQDEQNRPAFVVCDLPACTARQTVMHPPSTGSLRWMPDGRGIAYIDAETGSNLWVQPLDGSSPHQLTHFTDRTITDFAWSHDGTRLAISRATTTNDIVLFKGLRR
jgi:Tol biopolymer transport system component